MQKPALLRKAIEAAVPDLLAHPENLGMWVAQGSIKGRKKTLGHTQKYSLRIAVADLPSNLQDVVTIAILNWLQEWEPDLIGHSADGFSFETDILGDAKVDILYTIQLVEDVEVVVDQKNRVSKIAYRKPPQEFNDLTWAGLSN